MRINKKISISLLLALAITMNQHAASAQETEFKRLYERDGRNAAAVQNAIVANPKAADALARDALENPDAARRAINTARNNPEKARQVYRES